MMAMADGRRRGVLAVRLALLAGLFAAHGAAAQTGGPFEIAWSTVDAGGGASAGGLFSLVGTMGQCDAGASSGGQFVLAGGFLGSFGGPPACRCDWNVDGAVNSQDFFDFLTSFFGGGPAGDFNRDGVTNSQDFFDFLTCFFGGC